MKRVNPRRPSIPTLSLSPAEEHRIENEAAALLTQTLQIEHDFFANDSEVNEEHWKQLKSSDYFSIYKERHTTTESHDGWDPSASGGPKTRAASLDNDALISSKKKAQIPMIVSTGHVEGLMEDVVFGFAAGDLPSWRMRTAFTKDRFADAKILATINKPTEERPFNYLCVKWFVSAFPALLKVFVNPRDLLVLEASGVKVDTQGQRYGYYIIHDYVHPMIGKMDEYGICRCSISMCFIMREVRPGKVHIFSRGFVDPRGDMSQNVVLMLTSKAMLTMAKTPESSISKKLVWLMARQERERQDKNQRGRMSSTESVESGTCGSCGKPPGFLKSKLATCRLCRQEFCSRCIVEQRVVVEVTRKEMNERSFPFCLGCILKTKKMSPRAVALDRVRENAARAESSSSSERSTSNLSSAELFSIPSSPSDSDGADILR
ncbi:hypothetical protein Poli38472_012598 [Pythium oligandrum]|uniref:FYVE-type domain-containing protein n=1 Tax=Pythium oligandrum TaxID=41045 RepID=A0A8K1CFW2_PYTOL|nr:hypothetical protein Poli38472_012598 [Pythium oligandrum]|eukprot:TMW61407.1 hypothetical protein Poli38472_012598 [Pythium oligandrum]